jgi:hypothetical protein
MIRRTNGAPACCTSGSGAIKRQSAVCLLDAGLSTSADGPAEGFMDWASRWRGLEPFGCVSVRGRETRAQHE